MSEIIELAERLGKAIAASPEAAKLRQARKVLRDQKDVAQMLQDYQAQAEKIAKLTEEDKPVEVEDKRKLQAIQDKLAANDVFKKFTAAQVEYIDLMRKVNDSLRDHLGETEEGQQGP